MSRRSILVLSSVVLACVVLASLAGGCSRDDGRTLRAANGAQVESVEQTTSSGEVVDTANDAAQMMVTGAWPEGAEVDVRYTCDGLNVSPALSWSAGPEGTGSYAVILSDIDAPDYHHWVVANIPPGVVSLDEAFDDPTVVVGRNSAGKDGYTGPCPPKGERHTYDVAVYALDQMLEAQTGDPAGDLITAIESAAIDVGSTEFSFGR